VVVAAVVVGADLLLVLLARVEEHVRGEGEEDEMEDRPREGEAGPVIAVLHDVKAIAVELDVTIEVHLVKRLHWDLVAAAPSLAVFFLLESDVVLDGAAGELGLVVDARRVGRGHSPDSDQNRHEEDNKEKDSRLEAAAEAAGDEGRDAQQQRPKDVVREGLRAGTFGG